MELVANSIPKRFQAVSWSPTVYNSDDSWTIRANGLSAGVEADPCWALTGARGSEGPSQAHGEVWGTGFVGHAFGHGGYGGYGGYALVTLRIPYMALRLACELMLNSYFFVLILIRGIRIQHVGARWHTRCFTGGTDTDRDSFAGTTSLSAVTHRHTAQIEGARGRARKCQRLMGGVLE